MESRRVVRAALQRPRPARSRFAPAGLHERAPLIVLIAILAAAPSAFADITARALLATDLTSRGIPFSNGEAMAGISASWDHRSGVFLGADAFSAENGPVPERSRGVRAYAGLFRTLDSGRAWELSLAHTEFSGDFPSSWDYTEARADLHLSPQLSLSTAWSPDLQGRDVESLALFASWVPRLNDNTFLVLSVGSTYLGDDEEAWTQFGEAGVGLSRGRWELKLVHHLIDNRSVRLFHADGRNTTTLRLDYQLW